MKTNEESRPIPQSNNKVTLSRSPLITLHEAAALLRLSPRTLGSLVRRRRIPCYRFAGVDRLLFKPDELLALLQLTSAAAPSRRGPRPRLARE